MRERVSKPLPPDSTILANHGGLVGESSSNPGLLPPELLFLLWTSPSC